MEDPIYYKTKMEQWKGVNEYLYKQYLRAYQAITSGKKEVPKKEEPAFLDETALSSMTKDELNDFAARKFPNLVIKASWSKAKMMQEIEKLL